ncbi:MAG TPA: adenylate/guanylate cyclase domain-containing protein [Gaiellaceae bacterium]
MRELPSGTVTFLFTDVESSTHLLHQVGAEQYAEALSNHRRVIRDAFLGHGGVEVDTQGDAFFAAFPTASGALGAARDLTQALDGGSIKVRVGLHTGTPLVVEEGYVGVDVHRAARIAAAGHGGQVLVSSATAALVEAEGLHDLGEHRFKDLAAPERVYQLGDDRFPPLKSLYRTNLPVPTTPFLGRAAEIEEALGLLRRDGVRLLTLSGPGGTGKTRLALQVAADSSEQFPDGLWWVPLAALRDPALMARAVARSLDVDEEPGRPIEETLAERLAGKRSLLLLDNAEQLLPEIASRIASLLATAGPTVLVTSRERLRLQQEHVYAVPSLTPRDGVELFFTRARQVDASFEETPAVAELCRRLDDLPLALELAAARSAIFSPEQLLDRLGERLDLLKGGRDADPRQETLRATIHWSYDLLDPDEQQLLARLSVFADGCTHEAVEAICDADVDTIQSLIDKSLLRRRRVAGGSRYWMLETIREFASEELERRGETAAISLRHADFFATFVEGADPHLRRGPDQQGWARQIAEEYGNVRVAMTFALDNAPEVAGRLLGGLPFFLWLRGGFEEARAWVARALVVADELPKALLGKVHECGAVTAERVGDVEAASQHAEAAYAAFTEAGDDQGVADALRERGKVAMRRGDLEHARVTYEELAGAANRIGDAWNGAIALNNLGDLALNSGEWERVIKLCRQSSEIRLGLGDRWGSALALGNVAQGEIQLGRLEDASRSLRTALHDSLEVGANMVVAGCLDVAARLASARGRARESARLLGASDRAHEELGTIREAFERDQIEAARAASQNALGEEAFAAAVEEGRGMSLEEAAEFTLASLLDA